MKQQNILLHARQEHTAPRFTLALPVHKQRILRLQSLPDLEPGQGKMREPPIMVFSCSV